VVITPSIESSALHFGGHKESKLRGERFRLKITWWDFYWVL